MRNDVVSELSVSKKILLGILTLFALGVPTFVALTISGNADAQASVATPSVGKIELLDGKRVKLNYQDVDVRSLLKALADAAHVNMLVSDKVTGTVTVHLAETSWEQALNIILHAEGLTKHEEDGIIFVAPASGATGA